MAEDSTRLDNLETASPIHGTQRLPNDDDDQTYQVSRISRETPAFRPTLTLTRPRNEISRMAVNVTHINNIREISYALLEIFTQFSIYYNITDS